MAPTMRQLFRWIGWLLPHGLYLAYLTLQRKTASALGPVTKQLLASNAVLKDRHVGQRCFIVGNGPSVKQIDLRRLQGEIVFTVSNGYLHEGFEIMAPAYHCVPQITYGRMTEADVIDWFREMHNGIGEAELFLNESEFALVKKHGLFPGRRVRYLAMRESFDEVKTHGIIDISAPVPRVQSVPLMALMIALYMGFSEIILLGIDHDHFKTRRYAYAFDTKVQSGKDFTVDSGGNVLTARFDDFHALARLWRQYRVIKNIALANNRMIMNANPLSELDEFPMVSLESLLKKP